MNRAVVWILAIISALGMLYNTAILSLVNSFSYYSGGECVTANAGMNGSPDLCASHIPTVTLPSLSMLTKQSGWGPFFLTLCVAILIGLPAWIGSPILALRRGSSARLSISIIASVISALLILCAISVPAGLINAPTVCLQSTDASMPQTCYTGAQAHVVAWIGFLWTALAVLLLWGMPAWVMALTQTARLKQWGWFIAALLFSPIAAMLYAFFGASSRPTPGNPALAVPVTGPVASASPVTPPPCSTASCANW